jgi:transposase InsO family protein
MNIKFLRLDNGGEYTSNDFKYFCKDTRIKRELIVSYNAQQNGVVERNNRSIIDSSKDMIHDQELPMFFWSKACDTILYVLYKSPHKILGDMTPMKQR